MHWLANLFPPFSYVRSLVNMTRASLWIYFLTNDLAHRERIKTSEKKMSNEMTRENFTYKRSNKYRGIVNATFNMLSVVSCGKKHFDPKRKFDQFDTIRQSNSQQEYAKTR